MLSLCLFISLSHRVGFPEEGGWRINLAGLPFFVSALVAFNGFEAVVHVHNGAVLNIITAVSNLFYLHLTAGNFDITSGCESLR